MLIISSRNDVGALQLDAYTYAHSEFVALEKTLEFADVRSTFQNIDRDRAGREGRRYKVPSEQIRRLESVLGGLFDRSGQFTLSPGGGVTYACREIDAGGMGNGCQEFAAPNQDVATTKCALIARGNNWLGGVAQLGRCRNLRSGFLSRIFR